MLADLDRMIGQPHPVVRPIQRCVQLVVSQPQVSDDPVIQARADSGRTRHLQKEMDNFAQQAEICEELAQRKVAGGP